MRKATKSYTSAYGGDGSTAGHITKDGDKNVWYCGKWLYIVSHVRIYSNPINAQILINYNKVKDR
jgi:hypothetical protein